ncbi:MAG: hypothetical protein JXB35_14390 [Anaerolineae bacterium]|nr:hypothetical protein [Anaerolineae bacterium]
MPADSQTFMKAAQVAALRADFTRLLEVLDAPEIPRTYGAMLVGRFKRALSPLIQDLERLESGPASPESALWSGLADVRERSRTLLREALAFLGGVAIREAALDRSLAQHAQDWLAAMAARVGVAWSPAVIIGRGRERDAPEVIAVSPLPEDSLAAIPIPRWDPWQLPRLLHVFGYWVAKRGQIAGFDRWVTTQIAQVHALADATPPEVQTLQAMLPEVQALLAARIRAAQDGREAEFLSRHAADATLLARRQTVHLWRLIADALATYLAGPCYVYAFLFLAADPLRGYVEGAQAGAGGDSRFVPSDARRIALMLQILRAMDAGARDDPYAMHGPYGAEIQRIVAIWEKSADLAGMLPAYQHIQAVMIPWGEHLWEALVTHFGPQAGETLDAWREATQEMIPLLSHGSATGQQAAPLPLLNAAWALRARHGRPDHLRALTRDVLRLLDGTEPVAGLLAAAPKMEPAEIVLQSRVYDVETDIAEFAALFRSGAAPAAGALNPADREAVAGQFFRLLSEQDYGLRKQWRFFEKLGSPLKTTLPQVIALAQGDAMRELQQEVLDFLGGVLIRQHGLERGICTVADTLLGEYARATGVTWASRAIPGENPLFSHQTGLVHVPFPDWDICNLPLMAHEFGHVTAMATPAFLSFVGDQARTLARGHPEAAAWDEKQARDYANQRQYHLHEFFADAFAVYTQGPSFAYCMVFLHLNPAEAFLPRGGHPTHAERFEAILAMLGKLNEDAKVDEFDDGPYVTVMKRLRDGWQAALATTGAAMDEVARFHKIQALRLAGELAGLLERFFRLGAQYSPDDWLAAERLASQLLAGDVELHDASVRTLLNVAWACRVRYPDRAEAISRKVLTWQGL